MNNRPPRKRERQEGDYAKLVSRLTTRYDSLTDLPPNGKEGEPIVATSARRARGKVKANRKDPRTTHAAYTSTLVTRADGSQYVIPRKKPRNTATRVTTKRAVSKATVIKEILAYGAAERNKLSMDEIRRINGL